MTQTHRPKAILAGIQLPNTSDFEHKSSLDELERLVKTLGFDTIGRISQKRKNPAPGAIFGEGKIKELARWTGGSGIVARFNQETPDAEVAELDDADNEEAPSEMATVVIIDCELTPNQLSNLEKATGVEVLDRTGIILEIFSRHAKSREARLQVEIAKLSYLAPRLRLSRVGGDRQGGGIGAKGSGETTHELDRRRIRDRIAELRQQLAAIRGEHDVRRSSRSEFPLVALIGYTNAGKSSLMRQLTSTDVEGEDKLFATLDTKIRTLHPPTVPKILVSDTVGFIKKLPHDLVASFRSTLDEANSADLLLYVVDGSDPNFRSQLQTTREVMTEIGAEKHPHKILINKVDLVPEEQLGNLRHEFPDAIFLSAHKTNDVKALHQAIWEFFEQGMTDQQHFVNYAQNHLINKIRSKARILNEVHEDTGSFITCRALPTTHDWIKDLLGD